MVVVTGRVLQGLALVVLHLLVAKFDKCIVEHALLGWFKTKQFVDKGIWLDIVPKRLKVSQDINVDFLDARNWGTALVDGQRWRRSNVMFGHGLV